MPESADPHGNKNRSDRTGELGVEPIPGSESKQIAVRAGMDLASQQESLPVLEAFQEFLDYERRRTRRKLLTVSLFFLLLIMVILGAGGGIAYMFMRKVEDNVGSVESGLANLDESWQQDRQQIESSVAKALADAGRLKQNLEKERDTLRKLENALTSRSKGTDVQIRKLVQALLALNKKNNSLQSDLTNVRQKLEATSTREESAINTEPGAVPQAPSGFLELPIAVNNSRQTMNWRIPIPE